MMLLVCKTIWEGMQEVGVVVSNEIMECWVKVFNPESRNNAVGSGCRGMGREEECGAVRGSSQVKDKASIGRNGQLQWLNGGGARDKVVHTHLDGDLGYEVSGGCMLFLIGRV